MIFTKAYRMIGNKSVAIVGGGISSLSMLLSMSQQIKSEADMLRVKVFERNIKVGGRIKAQ